MYAPLSAPCVPLGFPSLAAAGGQTTCLGRQTMPGTEAVGQTAPETETDSQTAHLGRQITHGTKVGGPTATPSGLTARPLMALASPASPSSTMPRMMPTTLAMPRAAPTTSVVPHAASTTPVAPPAAPASHLDPLHYSCCPRAMREPLVLPLHQQSPPVKAVPVAPPVNPHLMITQAKWDFRLLTDRLTLSATSASTLSLVPSSVCATLIDPNW
jgi:hypothetical protein